LNSSLYSYKVFSEAQTMIEIKETETTETIVNFGKVGMTERNIFPNALLCWYKIQLSTSHIHDTMKNDSFMNHTAIIFENELRDAILKNENIKIKVHQVKGLVNIKFVKMYKKE